MVRINLPLENVIMNWNKITSVDQINELKEESKNKNILIFKHSTRCSVSSMAINRLERAWKEDETEGITPYYLDLIEYRDVSNEIQNTFKVIHESPQILLIKDGECIYDDSHMNINYSSIKANSRV